MKLNHSKNIWYMCRIQSSTKICAIPAKLTPIIPVAKNTIDYFTINNYFTTLFCYNYLVYYKYYKQAEKPNRKTIFDFMFSIIDGISHCLASFILFGENGGRDYIHAPNSFPSSSKNKMSLNIITSECF